MQNIIINRLYSDKAIFEIVPLKLKRKWMTESKNSFAYKCLPLNIANQYGWTVLSPTDFTIVWWGGKDPRDVDITVADQEFNENILSYFGESVFTLHLDFIIKTPENYSLYIRGVPNESRPGFKPLDAIVETDWLPFTFTYNFMLIEPGVYEFKKGDPLFTFFPIERNSVENFKLVEQLITDDKELHNDFLEYIKHSDKRKKENKQYRFYFNGIGPNKKYSIKNHITKLIFGGRSSIIDT